MITKEKNTWEALTQSFTGDLYNVLLQQHHAAQFIALAGKHLIPPQCPKDFEQDYNYLT
jgi:hypothetical protein